MDFKFSKDSDDHQLQEVAPEKKSQGALVVLLVILVGGFSYIYFFTDLVRPQGGTPPAPAPAAAPQVVKLPLPPRADAPAAAVAKKTDPPAATAVPQAAPKPPQTAAVVPPPAASPPVKPAPKVVAPPVKPADKKALPAPPAAKQEHLAPVSSADHAAAGAKKTAAAPTVPAKPVPVAAKKPVAAKPEVTADAKHAAPAHESGPAAEEGNWNVLIGNYVLEETLSADMGRVRKAGLVPVVKSAARKKTQMNRLLFSEFSDHAAARAALDKLKAHTSDAFILEKGGTYAVYAGSYLLTERVSSEKERLQAEGFPVTLQHSTVSIPAQSLTVGPFSGKKAASAAVKTLKGAGIKASLIRQ